MSARTSSPDASAHASLDEPTVIPTRSITPSQIDPDALKVVGRLQRFGHIAYLVGGCVRDLLLKRAPKDFDVVTSAQPSEVRKLFRNCRLIGRRFRLAHIHFRGKVIETATFRGAAEQNGDGDLLIRSDNVFGSEAEDARRRDFTVNALFYDPLERTLIDYVGGLEDLVARRLRFIGQPDIRVQEDPVRILRAIKFAARLNFEMAPQTRQAVVRYRSELNRSAPPRLMEEVLRMLRSGAAEASFHLMWETGVLEVLLPEVACYLDRALTRGEEREPGAGLWAYLWAIDRSDRELETNAVLLAALMIHPVNDASDPGAAQYGLKLGTNATGEVARGLLRRMIDRLRLPKREAERVGQLLACQRRLVHLRSNHSLPRGLMRRVYYPEALDLFEIGVRATKRGRKILNRLRSAYPKSTQGGGSAPPDSAPQADAAVAPETAVQAGPPAKSTRRRRSRSTSRRRRRKPSPPGNR